MPSRYDLIANVVHEGKAGQQTSRAPYRAHIHRAVEKTWYEVQVGTQQRPREGGAPDVKAPAVWVIPVPAYQRCLILVLARPVQCVPGAARDVLQHIATTDRIVDDVCCCYHLQDSVVIDVLPRVIVRFKNQYS